MHFSKLVQNSLLFAAASASLGACSGTPQAALIPANQASAPTAIPQSRAQQTIQPLTLPVCPPYSYHGAASVWDANAGQWITYVGWFGRSNGRLVPCAGALAVAGHNNVYNWFDPVCYASWWFVQSQARRATQGLSKKNEFVAVPVPSQNTVDVVKSTAKKSSAVDTISTAPYMPTSVVVSPAGTLYVAVVPPSGSQSSGIIVYPQGSTTPSGTLSDANLGQDPAQIAVDRREDLFVAYTVTSGSSTSAQIDEFPSGSTKAVPFATVPGATAGSLATTRRDDVLISTMRGSSGEVDIFDVKGRMAGKFPTTSNPGFITLNAKNDALTVVDPIGDLVSTYAYPSGQLQIQSSVGPPSQTWVPGGMLQP